ncbi:MAG: type II toxin-antitoxin system VapC family toxin [Verrucomicrobiota bacterium]
MNIYVDSALLVKAYCPEATSAEAIRLIQQEVPPLPLTHLHELEIRNALRLKRHRGELTDEELRGALADFQSDLDDGLLARPVYDLPEVYREAEKLSAHHAIRTGVRSLDVLHVAAALVIGAQRFASFDRRQRETASQAGLRVLPTRIPPSE